MRTFVIGSRGSQLALWQAHFIAARLKEAGVETRIEIIRTTGDHLQTASLVQAGGKGLFTKEIEDALLEGSIDLAVHSLKDLPTETPTGLTIAAIPERESPFDAMVGSTLAQLPAGARVGTSSNRRGAQLRILRPDLQIDPIRGNVDTRLRKQQSGEFHAIMLAAAGLRRLGLEQAIAEVFSADQICPAPGQGALAIETRAEDEAARVCSVLNHMPTEQAVVCERTVLAALGGGCQLPVGVFAQPDGSDMQAIAVVVAPDGSRAVRASASDDNAIELGHLVAERLLSRGASELLARAVATEGL
jgi:hydroxymethylbilane synthase